MRHQPVVQDYAAKANSQKCSYGAMHKSWERKKDGLLRITLVEISMMILEIELCLNSKGIFCVFLDAKLLYN